jgi:hypothetical protein
VTTGDNAEGKAIVEPEGEEGVETEGEDEAVGEGVLPDADLSRCPAI